MVMKHDGAQQLAQLFSAVLHPLCRGTHEAGSVVMKHDSAQQLAEFYWARSSNALDFQEQVSFGLPVA